MDIGVLNIGDELLAGKILNSNQYDIARLVTPLGHRLLYGQVIGDDESVIVHALRSALEPSAGSAFPPVDILILTGGLGPTLDDLTRQAAAAYLGASLEENADALAWLADFLRKPAAELPRGQRVQAVVPAGAVPLRNPAGTACGFRFQAGRAMVFAFPGVPKELQAMAALHLLPLLSGGKVLIEKGVWTWNWSESVQREALETLVLPEGARFSSLPGEKGVRLSLQLLVPEADQPRRQAEFDRAWAALLAAIPQECLVDAGGLALPAAVQALLLEKGATLSVAESCTGGGLGHLITETPGSSAVFHRGFLTYSNQAKMDLLGVSEEVLKAYGAVSEETALAMVSGCLERSRAAYACAITGIAGPDGGTAEKPVGTVWIAVAERSSGGSVTCHARRFQFRGDRPTIRQRAAYSALNQVRLLIQGKLG